MPRRHRLLAVAVAMLTVAGTAAVATASADSHLEACDRYQTVPVKNSRYIVMNNVWGATTAQCIEVAADGAFRVIGTKHHNTDAAASYPSIYAGCHWGRCTGGTSLPLPVAELKSVRSSWRIGTGAPGIWNATYDLWFHTTADVNRSPDGAELMIWLDRAGGANPSGTVVARNVRLAGAVWDIWYEDSAWNYIAYVRTRRTSAVRNLDLRAFTMDALARGYVNRSWFLSGVEAGFEIWQDGAGLESRSFNVTATRGDGGPPAPAQGPVQGPALTPALTTPAVALASCSVRWSTHVWNTGLLTSVTVTNHGPPLRDWAVSWAFTGDERIATDWGVRTTQTGRQVLARRTAYNAELPTGGTATFGFEARHGGTTRRPADIRLDGAPCAVR